MGPIEQTADGVRLRIRAAPRAKRTEIMGVQGGMIRIRLSAPPNNGAANEELIDFLARTLSVSRSAIQLRSGHASRSKVLQVTGVTSAEVEARLTRLLNRR
jgi:uncharacterized protein (TIGR00251 family)